MGLVDYAERELNLAGLYDTDSDYGGALGPAILRVVEAFAAEGHSGGSAAVSLAALRRLLRFKPLTPIQEPVPGDYIDVMGEGILQHCRDSELFSDDAGRTWYTIARHRVWWKPWSWAWPGEDRVQVCFPYMPD